MGAERFKKATNGRWQEILPVFGVGPEFLTGSQTPCPMCGGKDRFRFDDKQGGGTWFCNWCGAGTGFMLVKKVSDLDVISTLRKIYETVDGLPPGGSANRATPKQDPVIRIRKMLKGSKVIDGDDPASRYLRTRGLRLEKLPFALGYNPAIPYYDGGKQVGTFAAMVAAVRGVDRKLRTLHITYLEGTQKADVPSPRKVLPPIGTCKGAAVQLADAAACQEDGFLGVAEGIETALAASQRFGMPVWSVLSTSGLESFELPSWVRTLYVFGDSDASYAGQASAYLLARRVKANGISVEVRVPRELGVDWLDVLNHGQRNVGAA